MRTHKVAQNCSGVADKTEFVKVSEFDTLQLVSDYKFLEGLKDCVESSKRARQMGNGEMGTVRDACARENILLKEMPAVFTRHKDNKTRCKEGVILWTVEMVFTELNCRILTHDIPDSDSIDAILARYHSISTDFEQYKTVQRYFKFKPTITYLVCADVGKPNCYHQVSSSAPLREVLRYKSVIEFPAIHLVKDTEEYNIVPCEERVVASVEPKLKRKLVQRQKKWEKKNRMKKQKVEEKTVVEPVKEDKEKSDNSFRNSVLSLFSGD